MDLLAPPDGATLIRQSDIGQMQLCPTRLQLKEKEGYSDFLSEPLLFGSVVHAAIEHLMSGSAMLAVLDQQWIDTAIAVCEEERGNNTFVEAAFYDALRECVMQWDANVRPLLNTDTHNQEQLLFAPLDDTNFWLRGTPDIFWLSGPEAIDWKTAGRGWKAEKAQNILQAPLYTHLIEQNYGLFVAEWTFWVYNRSKKLWEAFPRFVDRQQVECAVQTALQYSRQIVADVFPATPVPYGSFTDKRGWYCSPRFCAAWNICDMKGVLGDGKHLLEERTELIAW